MTSTSDLIDAGCHTHAFHGKHENGKAFLLQDTEETDQQYVDRMVSDTQTCIANVQQLDSGSIDTLAYPFGISDKTTAKAIQIAGLHYAFTISSL
jgi:hypothetical protein